MKVTGPNWPSTLALRDALAGVDSPKILKWGSAPMNKLDAMNTLRAKGVASPEVTSDLATARRWINAGSTVWGRKLMHKEGRDIIQGQGQPNWSKRDFWVKFIPSQYDFRVHVWDGVAFRTGVKGHIDPLNASPVRSDRNGWLLNYNPEVYTQAGTKIQRNLIRQAAVNACAALGILGGAVDVLLGEDGNPYVLEVNTAPALGEFTLAAYVEVITKWATDVPEVRIPAPAAVIQLAPPEPVYQAGGLFGAGLRHQGDVINVIPPALAPPPRALQVGVAMHQGMDHAEGKSIILVINGRAHTIEPGDPRYGMLVAAVGV